MLPLTLFYTALLALLLLVLSIRVIRVRYQLQVSLGDNNEEALRSAIRAQGNFIEYVPMVVLLLGVLELREWPAWGLHGLFLMLLIGRCLHAYGIHTSNFRFRRWGMILTFSCMIFAILSAFLSLTLVQ